MALFNSVSNWISDIRTYVPPILSIPGDSSADVDKISSKQEKRIMRLLPSVNLGESMDSASLKKLTTVLRSLIDDVILTGMKWNIHKRRAPYDRCNESVQWFIDSWDIYLNFFAQYHAIEWQYQNDLEKHKAQNTHPKVHDAISANQHTLKQLELRISNSLLKCWRDTITGADHILENSLLPPNCPFSIKIKKHIKSCKRVSLETTERLETILQGNFDDLNPEILQQRKEILDAGLGKIMPAFLKLQYLLKLKKNVPSSYWSSIGELKDILGRFEEARKWLNRAERYCDRLQSIPDIDQIVLLWDKLNQFDVPDSKDISNYLSNLNRLKMQYSIYLNSSVLDKIDHYLAISEELIGKEDNCKERLADIIQKFKDANPIHNFALFLQYYKVRERYSKILQELRGVDVQLSGQMIQEQIEFATGLIDEIAHIIHQVDKEFAHCNKWLQLKEWYIEYQNQIDSVRRSKDFALKILNPTHFHRDCSPLRATSLLKNHPPGTYLLRPGSESDHIEMDYRVCSKNEDETRSVQVILGDKKEIEFQGRELSLEDLVLELSGAQARPLPHQPMDHLTAQFEWNLTDQSPEKLLQQKRKNLFCITRHEQSGIYILHSSGPSGVASYEIALHRNSCSANQNGETQHKAKSLHQLLSHLSGGKNYSIKGQISYPIFDALFYQSLLQQMQESKQEWIKVSRRLHHWLPYSVIANVNGEFYAQIHKTLVDPKKGFRGSGANKYVWDLKAINLQKKLVRVKIKDISNFYYLDSCSAISKMKKRIPPEKQQLLLLPTCFSYQKRTARYTYKNVYIQVMPSMIGDLFPIWENLPLKGRLNVALQVAEALYAMHKAGHAHLDVKLENIMIESLSDVNQPKVRLGDFDFAQTPNSVVRCGSPAYMDPNIILSNVSNLESAKIADQFSFGILLSYFLTGYSPRSYGDVKHVRPITLSNLFEDEYWSTMHPILQDILYDCLEGLNRTYKLKDIIRRLRLYIETFK